MIVGCLFKACDFFILDTILEDKEEDEDQMGDEAISSEGLRQGWLHHKCVGFSNAKVHDN